MVKITYIEADGRSYEIEAPEGWSLMEAAFHNGVEGIEAECGGACNCATCHVYIDENYLDKLPPIGPTEEEMLECTAAERRPNSRLSCQIELTAELDGMVVDLPETQI
ncbi:2Fe-2S iron-sulfur cluster binding domain-containing protein [Marinobacterium sp. D7]|uniref:2Fe-2S iron-sulfur cluster-binding protein n=1 Tax=Marinobacterium ramblicola TaxID=2849041 RepID=UPI001C2D9E5F|nr:2Fe-2S iron-sulfur cluster-binding protein [Marinobacterium ramblicola]MBV1789232.1 2Fe-2S iron-sulfur cluster binding domain-containing protein [Marinobacterium ramblicola]